VPNATPERNQEYPQEEMKESVQKMKKGEENSERKTVITTATSTP